MELALVVEEGLLHQGLAVVEHAVDLDGGDVLAEGGELALLYLAHLAFGVEHVDVYALHAEETVGYGRAGVAAGGHEHVHPLLLLLADEVLQQAGHEACAHVLEGQGGAVEEFERVDVLVDLHYRTVEREGVADDAPQVVGGYVLAEERIGHGAGDVVEREPVDVVVERLWERLDALGHIQAAVAGQSFHHGLVERGHGGFLVGAVVFHDGLVAVLVRRLFGWLRINCS